MWSRSQDSVIQIISGLVVVATLRTSSIFGTSDITFDKMIDGTKTLGEPVFGNLGEGVIGICGEKFPSFSELEVLSIETEVTGVLSGLGVWVQVVLENCDGTVVGTGTGKSGRGDETSNDGTGENSSDWGGRELVAMEMWYFGGGRPFSRMLLKF